MEQMPEPQAEQQQEQGSQDPAALAQEVASGLAKLAQILDSAPGATDEDRAQMAQVLEGFTQLVQKKLSAGGDPQAVPADPGSMPMEAGMSGKPMGPNSRQ